MLVRFATVVVALALSFSLAADESDAFFDDRRVHEVRIWFETKEWHRELWNAHKTPTDPYFPARFQSDGVELPKIGARFKGHQSFRSSGWKKPFKLDFDRFDPKASFFGLRKLNLHNFYLQPDFMREKLFLDFAREYVPALRAVYVDLYVNDVHQGLYLAVEQPDKRMIKRHFGKGDEGNLYEAKPRATLEYLGESPLRYATQFELETNEDERDFCGLLRFTSLLNNTPASRLPSVIEEVADVENLLTGLAIDLLFANLDSYLGAATEYYLYQRSDSGQFVRIHWDANEAFGLSGDGAPAVVAPARIDLFWTGDFGSAARPLATKLWAVPEYRRFHLRQIAHMLRNGFDPASMRRRIAQLATLIRPYVARDPNNAYDAAAFERALEEPIPYKDTRQIAGLGRFVDERYAYVRSELNGVASLTDLRIDGIADDGDAIRVTIYNQGPGPVPLGRVALTAPGGWRSAIPGETLADGASIAVRVPAGVVAQAIDLRLVESTTGRAIDRVLLPAPFAGQSYTRGNGVRPGWAIRH